MADEMPLRALVAEALGWEWRRSSVTGRRCLYAPSETGKAVYHRAPAWMEQPADGTEPLVGDWDSWVADSIPPYGEDSPNGWACTGPLLTRFEIALSRERAFAKDELCWTAVVYGRRSTIVEAASPCEAIARLVVDLHRAGRLHG